MSKTTLRSYYEQVIDLFERSIRDKGVKLSGGEIGRRLGISKSATNVHLQTLEAEYVAGTRERPVFVVKPAPEVETQLADPARAIVGSLRSAQRPTSSRTTTSNSKSAAQVVVVPPVIAKRGRPFEPEQADLVPWLRLIRNSFPRTTDQNVYEAATPDEKTEASILVSLAMAAARKHAAEAAGMSFESFKARLKSDEVFATRVKRAEASGIMTLHQAGFEAATLARPADRTAMTLALLRARAAADYEPSQVVKLQAEVSVDERVTFEPGGLFDPANRAKLISSILAEGERQRLRANAIDVEPIEVPALPEHEGLSDG